MSALRLCKEEAQMPAEIKLKLLSLTLLQACLLALTGSASAQVRSSTTTEVNEPGGMIQHYHCRHAHAPRATYYGYDRNLGDYLPSYIFGPFYDHGWWGPDPNHQDYGYW
jgi:hypothetical protein